MNSGDEVEKEGLCEDTHVQLRNTSDSSVFVRAARMRAFKKR